MTAGLEKRPGTAEFLERIEVLQRKAPGDIVRVVGSMAYAEQRKHVSVRVDPRGFKTIEVVMLTDVQFGHLYCNENRLLEYRDWILAAPNRFAVLGGDMVDVAHCFSPGSPYDNKWEPKEQLFRFIEIMMPLRHRIIGYVGGNHERRPTKMYGELGSMIATFLKIPYSAGKQYVDIHYGEHRPFKIELWHGRGTSRTKGAKMQMLDDFMRQGDAQLYLCGHLHEVMVSFSWRVVRNKRSNEPELEKYGGAMSSSFLEYWGTYGEVAGLRPSDTMMARAILEPGGRKWELTLR